MMKVLDGLFTVGLCYGLYRYYLTAPIFDAIVMVSLIYVAARQWKDANTVSLCLIGILFKALIMAIATGVNCMSGWVYWPLTTVIYFACILIVVQRPVIFSNFGPLKNRTGWAITNSDDAINFILALMIVFNILIFIEHVIRHTFYSVQFLYDGYEYVQAGLATLTVAILLFLVNTEKGKEDSIVRKQ
jgi:hypothetical protein